MDHTPQILQPNLEIPKSQLLNYDAMFGAQKMILATGNPDYGVGSELRDSVQDGPSGFLVCSAPFFAKISRKLLLLFEAFSTLLSVLGSFTGNV